MTHWCIVSHLRIQVSHRRGDLGELFAADQIGVRDVATAKAAQIPLVLWQHRHRGYGKNP